MASRIANVKRNIIALSISRIIGLLLPFITRTVIIYCLGAVYLGLNSLFTSILSVLSLAELGFGTAMVFSMYEPLANNDCMSVCALLNLYKKIYMIIGIIIFTIGLIFIPFLPFVIKGEYPREIDIYILYLINLINTVASYFLFAYKDALLVANQRTGLLSILNTAILIVLNVGQIIILFTINNYYIYCLFMPVTTILGNIMRSIIISKIYPQYTCKGKVSDKLIDDIRKRVIGLFVYKVCDVLRFSFDSIILSAFLGLTVLAKYNNYYYIMNAVAGTMAIVSNSITASIGNSIIKESQEKNYQDFNKIQMIYMWVAGFCTVSLFCLYQPFMNLWVGKKLMFDKFTMSFFCIYFFVNRWGDICYAYRQGAGLWWQDRIRPVVEAIANISLNILLVQRIGVIGVLLSTIIGLVFINMLWGSRVLFKHYFTDYKQLYYIKRIFLYTLVTFVACWVTDKMCMVMSKDAIGNISQIVMNICLCCCIPNVLFLIIYRWCPEFNDVKNLLFKLLVRK